MPFAFPEPIKSGFEHRCQSLVAAGGVDVQNFVPLSLSQPEIYVNCRSSALTPAAPVDLSFTCNVPICYLVGPNQLSALQIAGSHLRLLI